MKLFGALLSLSFASSPTPALAQTNVGCDAACPPLGYESDSSHLCSGAAVDAATSSRQHAICHPLNTGIPGTENNKLSFDAFKQPGRVTVVANYYTGCEAGRRESGVYAGIAQRIHDETAGRVTFVSSLKGGGDCGMWAGVYQNDAVRMGFDVEPSTMPLTVSDGNYDLRDAFFTAPYPHPSYIVLDENLEVTFKSVGPCCGYSSYYECTDEVALGLDGMLTNEIMKVYNTQISNAGGIFGEGDETTVQTVSDPTTPAHSETASSDQPASAPGPGNENDSSCQSTEYSQWSVCSKTCGDGGIQFRHRAHPDATVQTQLCPADIVSALPPCDEQCVQEFGNEFDLSVIASGLDSPRDLAFHPTPGVHLGSFSEGQTFHPAQGEELWVANGNNHSISIIASLGTEHQTTISRRDRGYYHYMNNITALAFNAVSDSGRNKDQDSFNYFAVCNDNLNDYVGAKEPNYFMGPTLYDTDTVNKPGRKNTVNRIGEDCGDPADQCFFLHADMLHESPACIGIVHDPELETAYGTVYWAFDATGDKSGDGGQLVRFDFSQPHGPGSMDHSIAVVRRYPEVKLYRDGAHGHGHAGMVIHPERRVLYVANPGEGSVVAVHMDTGRYSRTAREEYPIFSNRLPSFEYSIYECVEQEGDFVRGLDNPSGLALSPDGTRLFVAEHGGRIIALDAESGVVLQSIDLASMGYTSIGGLAISPKTEHLYFVDLIANEVVRIDPAGIEDAECSHRSHSSGEFRSALQSGQSQVDDECGEGSFSLTKDYSCEVDGTIPNGTLFEQVHTDTGYASDNPDVQSMAGMDEAAALLANRTDCEYDSTLNFDALLLGGYYCHVCLPRNHGSSCDAGGTCANVQWQGFTCDNEYFVDFEAGNGQSLVISSLHYNTRYPSNSMLELTRGVTYRFTIRTGAEQPVSIGTMPDFAQDEFLAESSVKSIYLDSGVTQGPILLTVDAATPDCLYMTSPGTQPVVLMVEGLDACPSIGVSEPSEEVNNTPIAPDLLPEVETSAGHISSIWGYFAILFISFVITFDLGAYEINDF